MGHAMRHDATYSPARSDGRRAGMTLIEILIAVGILAFGMFGILTMFPVAIRNVQTNFGNTRAAGVARQVSSALQQGELTLQPDVWNMLTDTSNDTDVRIADVGSDSINWADYKSIGALINAATDGPIASVQAGNGYQSPSFKVGALNPDAGTLTDKPWLYSTQNDNPEPVMPIYRPGTGGLQQTDFGWSATFLPLSMPLNRNTLYRAQIAVWRDYQLKYGPQDNIEVDTFWGYDGTDNDNDGTEDNPSEREILALRYSF